MVKVNQASINNIYENFFLQNKEISIKWLYLALFSLLISGFYSIIIVALRTPLIGELIKNKDFFKISLVIHVDCSVLVWFLSCCGIFMAAISNKKYNYLLKISYYLAYFAMFLIFLSPFLEDSAPILNNYIPILHNIYFILGIAIFFASILVLAIISIISSFDTRDLLAQITKSVSLLIIMAIATIQVAAYKIQNDPNFAAGDLYYYYERLFWAAGHLLQFSYTQIIILSWLCIAEANGLKLVVRQKIILFITNLNLIFAITGLYPLFMYDISSNEYINFYTNHMIYLGGIAPTIIGLVVIAGLVPHKSNKNFIHLKYSLFFSLLLFFYGGFIGILIAGTNVTIPAHYHGSIIGITISLMGVIFLLINYYKFGQIKIKLAKLQVILYSTGQLLHITGLAISGGYGVMRKDPSLPLSFAAKFNMGLMGAGGFIAIIGGVMFVIISYLAIIRSGKRSEVTSNIN